MGRHILMMAVFLGILALGARPAVAQYDGAPSAGEGAVEPYGQGSDFTAGPYYDRLVEQLIVSRGKNFDFTNLRNYYMRTAQYDPAGDETKDEMLRLAYKAQDRSDEKRALKALDDYLYLVRQHLGNLGVVMQALSLARESRRYGDPAFFETVQRGLMANVKASGDGQSLRTAYQVITMDEEVMLIRSLGLHIVNSEVQKSGIVYYNMYTALDAQGAPYTVYIDLTYPMSVLDHEANAAGASSLYEIRKR